MSITTRRTWNLCKKLDSSSTCRLPAFWTRKSMWIVQMKCRVQTLQNSILKFCPMRRFKSCFKCIRMISSCLIIHLHLGMWHILSYLQKIWKNYFTSQKITKCIRTRVQIIRLLFCKIKCKNLLWHLVKKKEKKKSCVHPINNIWYRTLR